MFITHQLDKSNVLLASSTVCAADTPWSWEHFSIWLLGLGHAAETPDPLAWSALLSESLQQQNPVQSLWKRNPFQNSFFLSDLHFHPCLKAHPCVLLYRKWSWAFLPSCCLGKILSAPMCLLHIQGTAAFFLRREQDEGSILDSPMILSLRRSDHIVLSSSL